MTKTIHSLLLLLAVAMPTGLSANSYWNQFRGPNDANAPDANLPIEFSGTKNVQWRTPIHDLGWSSPVVWKDQVWVTTAKVDGSRFASGSARFQNRISEKTPMRGSRSRRTDDFSMWPIADTIVSPALLLIQKQARSREPG